jgi:hypothetical protein
MSRWVVGATLLFAGCIVGDPGGKPSPPPRPIVQFPSPAALAAAEQNVLEPPAIVAAEVPAEGWAVEPDAATADTWMPRGPMEEAIAAAFSASGKKAQPTHAMSCVAKELGRFQLAHGGQPPEALQRFMAAVCGVYAPTVGFQWLRGDVPSHVADARLADQWRAGIQSTLIDHLPADARHVGFWFGRQAGQAIALAAHEEAPVTIKMLSPIPDSRGNVLVVGRFEGEAAAFDAYINQGRFGVQRCQSDPMVVHPDFRITCHVAPEDQTAWLEIAYVAPHSVLALPLVEALAWRDPAAPPRFVETPYATAHPVGEAGAFAPAVLAELNRARAEAGLPAVRLSEAESAVAARVARPYFASVLSPGGAVRPADSNTIVLGLMAGWQVTGTIREGTFFSAVVPNTHDAGRWVDLALSLPLGRYALLARDIDEVALGPALFGSPEALGAVACGYRFQHDDEHAADAAAVFGRIAAARARMGLSVPKRLGGGVAPLLARGMGGVGEGRVDPYDALRTSLQMGAESSGARALKGYLVEATSVDVVELPPQFLSQPNMALEVAVTHYKPPGAAWAQLVILIVYDAAAIYTI